MHASCLLHEEKGQQVSGYATLACPLVVERGETHRGDTGFAEDGDALGRARALVTGGGEVDDGPHGGQAQVIPLRQQQARQVRGQPRLQYAIPAFLLP